jgi:hypothetical protein
MMDIFAHGQFQTTDETAAKAVSVFLQSAGDLDTLPGGIYVPIMAEGKYWGMSVQKGADRIDIQVYDLSDPTAYNLVYQAASDEDKARLDRDRQTESQGNSVLDAVKNIFTGVGGFILAGVAIYALIANWGKRE